MLRYTLPAILLHWLIALLIISAFALGVTMVDIPGITPTKLKYFSWHKWLGITVLGFASLRLLWRLGHKAPKYPAVMPDWQRSAAHGLHALLYVLMFAIPVSGYLYSLAAGVPVVYLGVLPLPAVIDANPEWKPIFKQIHYWFNMTLLTMFALHVAAALKHHFIDRDGVFKRMLP
ncbi:cytochrome b [Noviherbaspirillum saxi]|uniref:Cytochrome b n=1 Tax=Noviherbaspirillum saxi TaxID=2320863 RepID=A0A3A3GF46_9BURK|nr:cytochrome b [Noviherbaspirillum saxi]RJF99529.1 cytochrome b [Noviherbaspirillum saxi]